MTSTEKGRRLRERRIAAGLCVACGVLAPKPGRKRCEACIADSVDRRNQWRAARSGRAETAGLCTRCLSARPRTGRRHCLRCCLLNTRRKRAWRAARRKEVAHA